MDMRQSNQSPQRRATKFIPSPCPQTSFHPPCRGPCTAGAIYNPENVVKLETAFREEIERAAKSGFTEEELAAAKSGLLQSRKVQRSKDPALARILNSYLHYGRDFQWDAQREEAIRNLTVARVNDVISRHLDYSKMITVKAGDFKKSAAP